MSWRRFLFSPTGRINRARYWGAVGIQYGLGISVWLPLAAAPAHVIDDNPIVFGAYACAAAILTVACIVSHVFAQIKRFHDRNKAWPWIFIGFAPYIGGIWILIELGMLRGTTGHNRYGSDPLQPNKDIIDVFGPSDIAPFDAGGSATRPGPMPAPLPGQARRMS